jgi:hypothetical protein
VGRGGARRGPRGHGSVQGERFTGPPLASTPLPWPLPQHPCAHPQPCRASPLIPPPRAPGPEEARVRGAGGGAGARDEGPRGACCSHNSEWPRLRRRLRRVSRGPALTPPSPRAAAGRPPTGCSPPSGSPSSSCSRCGAWVPRLGTAHGSPRPVCQAPCAASCCPPRPPRPPVPPLLSPPPPPPPPGVPVAGREAGAQQQGARAAARAVWHPPCARQHVVRARQGGF